MIPEILAAGVPAAVAVVDAAPISMWVARALLLVVVELRALRRVVGIVALRE